MKRLLGGLFALVLSFTVTVGGAPQAQAAVPEAHSSHAGVHRYVALGDSFAAGYGLPSRADPASQLCARSNLAYPELLDGFRKLRNLDFVACSGASTKDLWNLQLAALSSSTRTVTLTIGGNDAGFAELGCLRTGCDLAQLSARVKVALAALAGLTPSDSVVSLPTILAAIHARAPHARIFVTGYPELFGTSPLLFGTKVACPVALADRTLVNGLTAQLNAVIKVSVAAARATGVRVTYVGVAAAFDRHGLCDVSVPLITNALHPSALGQATYATLLILRGVAR